MHIYNITPTHIHTARTVYIHKHLHIHTFVFACTHTHRDGSCVHAQHFSIPRKDPVHMCVCLCVPFATNTLGGKPPQQF